MLLLHGIVVDPASVRPGDGSAEAMLAGLREQGVVGRIAHARTRELAALELPALVQTAAGTWAVLQSASRSALRALGASAAAHRTIETLPSTRGGSLRAAIAVWCRRHRGRLATIAAATALVQLLAITVPLLTKVLIDDVLHASAPSSLTVITIALLFVAVYQAGFGWLRAKAITFLRSRFEVMNGRLLLEHIFALPFRFFDDMPTSALLQGFAGLAAARDVASDRVVGAAIGILPAIVSMAVLFALLPAAAAATVGVILLMLVAGIVSAHLQANAQRLEIDAQVRQRALLLEMLSGVTTVKAAGAAQRLIDRWKLTLADELQGTLGRQRVALVPDALLDLLRQTALASLMVSVGFAALSGKTTVGGLVMFLQLAAVLLATVTDAAAAYAVVKLLRGQLRNSRRLLAEGREVRSPRLRRRLEAPVIVEDLWFRYGADRPWVLRGYALELAPGGKLRLDDPSGAGKTTLLRLLAGLYPPDRGTVTIGGLAPAAATGTMLYLPQFAVLYAGSLLENLRLFSGGADEAAIAAAAHQTGLDEYVQSLPMKYHTVVASNANFSGGQRQWILLTAALASDRPLLLLDEPIAQLDAGVQRRIVAADAFQSKTIIYASHTVLEFSGGATT